jgi:hypothetical protein
LFFELDEHLPPALAIQNPAVSRWIKFANAAFVLIFQGCQRFRQFASRRSGGLVSDHRHTI